jgi:hypothetical protein
VYAKSDNNNNPAKNLSPKAWARPFKERMKRKEDIECIQ